MKHLFAALALLLTASAGRSAVLTVNNNNPSPGQYNTLAGAQSAASPGDTLLIAGSPYNYNSITITKRLTLIGTGHKPVGDFPAVSKLDDINFSGTNTDLYDCNFIGLDVNTITYNVANTKRGFVSRCKIRTYIQINSDQDSLLFEGNFFEWSSHNLYFPTTFILNNITVKNNVFNGIIYNFYPNGGNNIYFDNNLFLVNNYVFQASNRYLQFRNNIFFRADPNSAVTSSSFDNNILYKAYGSATSFPTTNSNTSNGNLSTDPLFTTFAANGDYYGYAYDFTLQSTSPAINAGTDGKDIGLSGGSGYFQKYGIPNIPQVNQFSITSPANATVAPGGTLQISFMSTIAR
jgi:hypothetical protein